MVKKHKLTPDDLECSEGGIHDFKLYHTTRDICKMIWCCPCILIFELCCDCSLCGARDPERDGFGGWGKAHGKRPCVKCAMTYQEAKSQLSVMTDDEKQRVWNETYGEQTVYLTRAQEHQQQHLEVVASHHDAQQLNDAYAQTHDGHQRRQSASGPTPPYPRTQMQQDPQYSRSPPGHLAPPSYNP